MLSLPSYSVLNNRRFPKMSLVFWLEPLLTLLAVFRGICFVNGSLQFHGFSVLGGFVCPAEYIDIKAQVSSTTKCLLHCVATPSCRGATYEEDTLRCIKCSTGEFLETASTPGIIYKRHERKGDREAMFGNFSYEVVFEKKSWNDAKINCENMGGYLTSIKSNDEQEFLTSLIPSNYTWGFWIGGNGTAGDINSFKWLDGTWVSAGYSNWDTNDVVKLKGSDCMKMMQLTGYQWKNKNCGQTIASFCKFG